MVKPLAEIDFEGRGIYSLTFNERFRAPCLVAYYKFIIYLSVVEGSPRGRGRRGRGRGRGRGGRGRIALVLFFQNLSFT